MKPSLSTSYNRNAPENKKQNLYGNCREIICCSDCNVSSAYDWNFEIFKDFPRDISAIDHCHGRASYSKRRSRSFYFEAVYHYIRQVFSNANWLCLLTMKFLVQIAARRYRQRPYKLFELYRAVLKNNRSCNLRYSGSEAGHVGSAFDRWTNFVATCTLYIANLSRSYPNRGGDCLRVKSGRSRLSFRSDVHLGESEIVASGSSTSAKLRKQRSRAVV